MPFGDSMQERYNSLVLYFLLFSLLLLGSAYLLFDAKIGFSYNRVLHYYQGGQALFTASKSFGGILKIILPHIFAFGLFLMVLLHFEKTSTAALFHLHPWHRCVCGAFCTFFHHSRAQFFCLFQTDCIFCA